jgi:hypothetical protein
VTHTGPQVEQDDDPHGSSRLGCAASGRPYLSGQISGILRPSQSRFP